MREWTNKSMKKMKKNQVISDCCSLDGSEFRETLTESFVNHVSIYAFLISIFDLRSVISQLYGQLMYCSRL